MKALLPAATVSSLAAGLLLCDASTGQGKPPCNAFPTKVLTAQAALQAALKHVSITIHWCRVPAANAGGSESLTAKSAKREVVELQTFGENWDLVSRRYEGGKVTPRHLRFCGGSLYQHLYTNDIHNISDLSSWKASLRPKETGRVFYEDAFIACGIVPPNDFSRFGLGFLPIAHAMREASRKSESPNAPDGDCTGERFEGRCLIGEPGDPTVRRTFEIEFDEEGRMSWWEEKTQRGVVRRWVCKEWLKLEEAWMPESSVLDWYEWKGYSVDPDRSMPLVTEACVVELKEHRLGATFSPIVGYPGDTVVDERLIMGEKQRYLASEDPRELARRYSSWKSESEVVSSTLECRSLQWLAALWTVLLAGAIYWAASPVKGHGARQFPGRTCSSMAMDASRAIEGTSAGDNESASGRREDSDGCRRSLR